MCDLTLTDDEDEIDEDYRDGGVEEDDLCNEDEDEDDEVEDVEDWR